MHAVLTPVGSAGDVNPFIVIGRELRRRGHAVTMIAAAVFAGVAARAGLEFVGVGTAEDYERATNNPDLWNAWRGPKVVFRELASQLRAGYAAIEQVYRPPETVLVGHTLSLSTRVFEDCHQVPALTMHLAPSLFRSQYRQPVSPAGTDISAWPRPLKRGFWWAIDRFAIDPLVAPALNRWRAELGLPPVSRVLGSWIHSPQRVIGLFPDWFGDPQRDWPAQLRLTGFALSDKDCAPDGAARADDDALARFLAAGDPPVVVTPGSANQFARPFFEASVEAAGATGRRALLVTKYREHLPAPLPAHAHHASYADFATLFPRAAAVVHHGGIGTCAQALAAGVPQLIMPMGFDQPDNAARVTRLGVAEVVAPQTFRAARVATALRRLLSRADVAASCRRWRETIAMRPSVEQTADLIVAHHRAQTSRM
jgi:rhamnosyltransferase subunit B